MSHAARAPGLRRLGQEEAAWASSIGAAGNRDPRDDRQRRNGTLTARGMGLRMEGVFVKIKCQVGLRGGRLNEKVPSSDRCPRMGI